MAAACQSVEREPLPQAYSRSVELRCCSGIDGSQKPAIITGKREWFKKIPAISVEVICTRWKQCSRMKSSKKVSRTARGRSGLTSEELALPACPTDLDDWLLLFGLAGRRLFALHLERVISAPVVRFRS